MCICCVFQIVSFSLYIHFCIFSILFIKIITKIYIKVIHQVSFLIVKKSTLNGVILVPILAFNY